LSQSLNQKTERAGLVTLYETLHKQTTTSFQQELRWVPQLRGNTPFAFVTVLGIKVCTAEVRRPPVRQWLIWPAIAPLSLDVPHYEISRQKSKNEKACNAKMSSQ
jgi:hypothetical protein